MFNYFCNMNRATRIISVTAILLLVCFSAAQGGDVRQRYIERYKDIAMEQMREKGVPASITLAQGCLESGNGLSTLATQGNNHFGIKCHNWTGEAIYHDDDETGECFRRYNTAEESFRDHSDFLRYRDRYAFLFELEPTDYKGWAEGLKKAGYATDPNYAAKLIEIIEAYDLGQYDLAVTEAPQPPVNSAKSAGVADEATAPIPPSPASLEKSRPAEQPRFRNGSVGDVTIGYNVLEKHGICYIIANGSDTYSSIAREFNLFRREILAFNEEKSDRTVEAGTVVYLQAKRKQSDANLAKHVVEKGETMKELSQRFAVRLKHLYKYNNMAPGAEPAPGSIINLRKEEIR